MKLSQLPHCTACNNSLPPIWYVVRMSMALLDRQSTMEVLGTAGILGGSSRALAIAEVMAPNAEVVKVGMDHDPKLMTEIYLCMACYTSKQHNLAVLAEAAPAGPR